MAARQTQQLCVVTIGYQRYLLPQAQALKFMEVASKALTAEYDYDSNHRCAQYRIGDPPEVELATVRTEQLIMPDATLAPAKPKRSKPAPLRLN